MYTHFQFEQLTSVGSFPWLSTIVATLFAVSILLLVAQPLAKFAKQIALATALVVLAEFIYLLCAFDYSASATYQFSETYEWINAIGATWSMGVNAFSLAMLVISAVLVVLVLVYGYNDDKDYMYDGVVVSNANRAKNYVALVLMLEAFIVMIFAARDVFVFYIAFEAMLVPVYFMIASYGIGKDRAKAAVKFMLYSLLGGLIMLVGVILIFMFATSEHFYNLNEAGSVQMPLPYECFAFITFFIAFAIKAPMVPLHTWLTTTAENARPTTSVLLVGILDKIGTFGMLNIALVLFPNASKLFAPYIVIWAVVSVFYGAFRAVAENNLLRLVSLTSVSHFGFIVLGIYIGSDIAMAGAMLYMVAHAVTVAGLFLLSGAIYERFDTVQMDKLGGLQRVTPVLAGTFLVTGLATVALPGLSGFVPEYLVLVGTYQVSPVLAGVAVLAVIFAAVYILLPYQKVFTGPKPEVSVKDLDLRQKSVVGVLIVLMLALGLCPNLLLDGFGQIADEQVAVVSSVEQVKSALPEGIEYEYLLADLNKGVGI